jgi:hypothetical protein
LGIFRESLDALQQGFNRVATARPVCAVQRDKVSNKQVVAKFERVNAIASQPGEIANDDLRRRFVRKRIASTRRSERAIQ